VLLMQHERSSLIDRTLGAMNRQLSHMVRLIDDLLDVSRISRGTLEVRRERADLASVIERAVETVNPCFVARQQTVAIEAEAPIRAWIDATRIAQIVANLLNNASRYSPAGSRIRVRLRREGELAVVQVIDPGAGIPEEQLGRLFGMFTKIERVNGTNGGSSDGLGIGLALSRQLAELHGGTLTAESAGEGKGATFTLAIPIGHAELVAWGVEEEEGSAPPRSSRRAGLHVVVVEDNTDTADMMSVWLAELGHEVKVARTGPDGVALILEAHPDVVLCDIGLPGMDGVDVCKHVVGEMTTPPVMIALTGWGMETDRRRTVQAGFHHHLVKPVEPDELLRVLDSVRTAATRMRADA
jgi:CheY-like chemotaxis protein